MSVFSDAVATAAEGTPYTVTPTAAGFDVGIDVVDAQWFGVFNAARLSKQFTHHVRVEGETYSITDEARSVEWVAGTPRVAATAERQYGRVIEVGAQKVWAFDAQGRFGVQADYRFDSSEGRDLVRGVARQLGLEERRGGVEKGAIVMALIGGGGALLALVVILVLAVLGKL